MILSAGSASALDTLFCQVHDKAVDALNYEDGWTHNPDCSEALTLGEVCFTGSRAKIIERINNEEERVGSDENWIEDARYHGADLKYTAVDGPNEWSETYIIKRCK